MKLRTSLYLIAILATVFAPLIPAQEFRGSILGRITDTTGAVVPAADIKVTNADTNVAVETKSNAEGNYTVPFVIPGHYTVTVSAQGFRSTEQPGVVVQINDRIELNLTLQIGT